MTAMRLTSAAAEKLGAALSLRFIYDVMHRQTGGDTDG